VKGSGIHNIKGEGSKPVDVLQEIAENVRYGEASKVSEQVDDKDGQ